MGKQRQAATGRVFHGGSDFVAEIGGGQVDDIHVKRVLEEGFQFLLSDDDERIISGYRIKKRYTDRGQPIVSLNMGGTVYRMTQSSRGPGAAQLLVIIPFLVGTIENYDEPIEEVDEDVEEFAASETS